MVNIRLYCYHFWAAAAYPACFPIRLGHSCYYYSYLLCTDCSLTRSSFAHFTKVRTWGRREAGDYPPRVRDATQIQRFLKSIFHSSLKYTSLRNFLMLQKIVVVVFWSTPISSMKRHEVKLCNLILSGTLISSFLTSKDIIVAWVLRNVFRHVSVIIWLSFKF